MPKWTAKYLPWVLLLTLPAGIFLFFFVTDRFIYSYDTLNLFYVGKRWFWSMVGRGHIPLWNENLFGGFSVFGSPASGYTSPISALFYLIFPSILAEELQLPLFAVFAAAGMYLWLKRLTGSINVALLVALAYALSGPLLSLADRSHIFFSVCLYPWAFLCFDWIVERRRGAVGLLATVFAMMVIHADWVAVCLLILLFGILSLRQDWNTRARLLLSAAWALGLSALALLPSLLNVAETTRVAGFTLEQTSFYSFHPLRLLSFFVPEAWGQPYDFTFYGQSVANAYKSERFWYHSIYLGLPITLLALGGLKHVRSIKYAWLGLAVAGGFLLLAFGNHFALHEFLFHALPGYSKLRFPEKFLLYTIFACFPLAALTAARIQNWRPWFIAMATVHCAVFLLPFAWADLLHHVSPEQHYGHLILAAILLAVATRKTWIRYALPVLIGITVAELWLYAPAFSTAPLAEFSETSVFTETLRGKRYVRDANVDAYCTAHPLRGLLSNWPMLSDLREAFGYESITPYRNESLVGHEIFENLEAWAPVLNVTYLLSIISPKPAAFVRLAEKGLLEPVVMDKEINTVLLAIRRKNREFSLICKFAVVDGEKAAFEGVRQRYGVLEPLVVESNPAAGAVMAAQADCGSSNIQLLERTSERRVYSVTTQTPMWLVERESFDRGWRAYIDGQEQPVWHVDFINRGIAVPAGQHRIESRFAPPGLHFAALLSLISFVLLLLYFAICAKRTIPQLSHAT